MTRADLCLYAYHGHSFSHVMPFTHSVRHRFRHTHSSGFRKKKPITIPEAYLLSRGPRSPSVVPGLPTDEPPYVRVRFRVPKEQSRRCNQHRETLYCNTHTHREEAKGTSPLSNFSANFIYPWGQGLRGFTYQGFSLDMLILGR